jgi:hypothetical protein
MLEFYAGALCRIVQMERNENTEEFGAPPGHPYAPPAPLGLSLHSPLESSEPGEFRLSP